MGKPPPGLPGAAIPAGAEPRKRTPAAETAPSAFELLLQEVQALPSIGVTRTQVLALLLRFAGERVYIPKAAAKAQREEAAARMLANRTPRRLIVRSLMDTHGIGRTQAYKTVNRAMKAR